jgi:hypothetical protein
VKVEVDKLLSIRSISDRRDPTLAVADRLSYWAQTVVAEWAMQTDVVDPWSLAERAGIQTETGDLEATFGLAIDTARGKRIIVKRGLPDWAARFVCAHELAHHILFFPDDEFAHEDVRFVANGAIAEGIEKVCDIFALALLIPARALSAFIRPTDEALGLVEASDKFNLPIQLIVERLWHLHEWMQVSACVATVVNRDVHLSSTILTVRPRNTTDDSHFVPDRSIRLFVRNGRQFVPSNFGASSATRAESLDDARIKYSIIPISENGVCMVRI